MNSHEFYIARAIRLAEKGCFTAKPNPVVGCVIVKDDVIVGEGWHQEAGKAHAEIIALQKAGEHAKNSTLYVSLEPCAHHGKTPPCVDAIITAGVSTVVIACVDPNPRVAGQGMQKLEAAGINVISPVLEQEALQLNQGFFKRMKTGLPFVRLKMAMSLDGKVALASGESQWITGPAARRDVQRLRARSSAIITGINTILQDDPRLNLRTEDFETVDADIDRELALQKQPLRVIIDSQAKLPPTANILQDKNPVLWITAQPLPTAFSLTNHPKLRHQLFPNNFGKVDLPKVLHYLGGLECNDVLIEAGPSLASSFLNQRLIDELIIYQAPILMGDKAQSSFIMPKLRSMQDCPPLRLTQHQMIGKDWKFHFSLQY